MSTLLYINDLLSIAQTTTTAVAHTTAAAAGHYEAAGEGILDWGNSKVSGVQVLIRGIAGLAALWFVLSNAIKSGGNMARIVISGAAAGVFMWIVWNVTAIQDRVDNEVNSAPATSQTSLPSHSL